jgi:hypothetical protein
MFAADLSWTDTNDQSNREKRERERKKPTESSSAVSLTGPRSPKNKDDSSSFARSIFRRKLKHDENRSWSSSSSGSSRPDSSAELHSSMATSIETETDSFAKLGLEEEILSIECILKPNHESGNHG